MKNKTSTLDVNLPKPLTNSFENLDLSLLQGLLQEHQDLLERHGSLAWLEETLVELQRSFQRQSGPLTVLAQGAQPTRALRAQRAIEGMATQALAQGYETITRSVDACLRHTKFEADYRATVEKVGPVLTTRQAALRLEVSPWNLESLMKKEGAVKIHLAKKAHSFPLVFWRLEDCKQVKRRRLLN